MLRCPLCHLPLHATARAASCEHGHTFDRAREGYFNLLPVQRKHSLDPGDDAAMVAARARFFAAGHYEPLRAAVTDLVASLRPDHLLDCGCGEGWYTVSMKEAAHDTTAIDISKHDQLITVFLAGGQEIHLTHEESKQFLHQARNMMQPVTPPNHS